MTHGVWNYDRYNELWANDWTSAPSALACPPKISFLPFQWFSCQQFFYSSSLLSWTRTLLFSRLSPWALKSLVMGHGWWRPLSALGIELRISLYHTVECGNTCLMESGCPISPDTNSSLDGCRVLKIPLSGNKSLVFHNSIPGFNCVKPKLDIRYHLRLTASHINDSEWRWEGREKQSTKGLTSGWNVNLGHIWYICFVLLIPRMF